MVNTTGCAQAVGPRCLPREICGWSAGTFAEPSSAAQGIDLFEAKCRPDVTLAAVIPQNEWFEAPGGLTIDSGAAEPVIPEGMCDNHLARKSLQQDAGMTASGEKIENLGEKKLKLALSDGKVMAHTFQVTSVNKPLGSVYRICQAGQQVVCNPPGHPDESYTYIRNLTTGARTPMSLVNDTYKLQVCVDPNREMCAGPFQGQGM